MITTIRDMRIRFRFRNAVRLLILAPALFSCAAVNFVGQSDGLSTGIYRIPYENETQVWITNDVDTHKPKNRLDMVGLTSENHPHRIVAAASGIVRYIVDGFNARQNPTSRTCRNNYVWLEHPNGEWTKYSHLQRNSVSDGAKLKVGDQVEVGAYLGNEGEVGCASGNHLHFEVAIPYNAADPIILTGGFIKGENRIPRICGIRGQTLLKHQTYTAGPCLD